MNNVKLLVSAILFCTAFAKPTIADDASTALQLIRDKGFRCQQVIKIKPKAIAKGWRVTCFAESYDTNRTSWGYQVVNMPRGWTVVPNKINSELPLRCQSSPDKACQAP